MIRDSFPDLTALWHRSARAMNDPAMKDPDFTEIISCELAGACASDLAVVNAARISFDAAHTELDEGDEKLINYLLRNRHGTPFEHGYFKFLVEAPIFVFREHHRHRIGHSYNEMSGRYTELTPKFYVPRCARVQTGKPGSYHYEDEEDLTKQMRNLLVPSYLNAWTSYQSLLRLGIAKEQARVVLPVGIYTKMLWSCNPRSLMNFLSLRLASTAQQEIRTVAQAASKALEEYMPVTWQAYLDHGHAP